MADLLNEYSIENMISSAERKYTNTREPLTVTIFLIGSFFAFFIYVIYDMAKPSMGYGESLVATIGFNLMVLPIVIFVATAYLVFNLFKILKKRANPKLYYTIKASLLDGTISKTNYFAYVESMRKCLKPPESADESNEEDIQLAMDARTAYPDLKRLSDMAEELTLLAIASIAVKIRILQIDDHGVPFQNACQIYHKTKNDYENSLNSFKEAVKDFEQKDNLFIQNLINETPKKPGHLTQ